MWALNRIMLLALLSGALLALPLRAETLKDKFKAFDADHDGVISRVEYDAGGERTYKQIDADQDGSVTVDEVVKWLPTKIDAPRRAKRKIAASRRAIRAAAEGTVEIWDGDRDGVVSAAEYKAFADGSFDRSDGDHDGRITFEEFKAGTSPQGIGPNPS